MGSWCAVNTQLSIVLIVPILEGAIRVFYGLTIDKTTVFMIELGLIQVGELIYSCLMHT